MYYAIKLENYNAKAMHHLLSCVALLPREQISYFFTTPQAALYELAEQCNYAMLTQCTIPFIAPQKLSLIRQAQKDNRTLDAFYNNKHYLSLKLFMLQVNNLLHPEDSLQVFSHLIDYIDTKECGIEPMLTILSPLSRREIIKFDTRTENIDTLADSIKCISKVHQEKVINLKKHLKYIIDELYDIRARAEVFKTAAKEKIKLIANDDEKAPATQEDNSFVARYQREQSGSTQGRGIAYSL